MNGRIVDVEFIRPVETLFAGWDVWEARVQTEDGAIIEGRIQGDGFVWDEASFEEDEGDI